MTLASTLRSDAEHACQTAAEAKIKEHEDRVVAAKSIAEGIIQRLPDFLEAAAQQGVSQVYVVGIDQYPPWSFEWPKTKTVPADVNALSLYKCQQLFGVSRHVALWAQKNGFKVRIQYPRNYFVNNPKLRVFDYTVVRQLNVQGRGIVLGW
jgi:hypothetical protein